MIDEDDMMLESYLLKHSDIEVCCDWGTQNDALYGNHVYEVI